MLTKLEKEMIDYVQQYGFITIGQCYSIWLSNRKYGYDIARKHLNKIVEAGYLKSYKPISNIYAEKVYFMDNKYATPARHMIVTMNVYAELKRLGVDIKYFKREQQWINSSETYRSDAFIVFTMNGFVFSAFIEVIDSTKLNYVNHKEKFINKYTAIYNSKEPVDKITEILGMKKNYNNPTLVVISEITNTELEIPNSNILYLDFSLQKLSQILI